MDWARGSPDAACQRAPRPGPGLDLAVAAAGEPGDGGAGDGEVAHCGTVVIIVIITVTAAGVRTLPTRQQQPDVRPGLGLGWSSFYLAIMYCVARAGAGVRTVVTAALQQSRDTC